MDQAVVPRPVDLAGKHEKPTTSRTEKVPTEYTKDGAVERDDYTQTVTD